MVGFLYAALWAVTACCGTPQIRRAVLEAMPMPPSSADMSSEAGFCSGPIGSDRPLPYHWCVARACGPLVVVTHSGFVVDTLEAEGCSTVHLWFFGAVVKWDFVQWIS
jgi:hypothetical protein